MGQDRSQSTNLTRPRPAALDSGGIHQVGTKGSRSSHGLTWWEHALKPGGFRENRRGSTLLPFARQLEDPAPHRGAAGFVDGHQATVFLVLGARCRRVNAQSPRAHHGCAACSVQRAAWKVQKPAIYLLCCPLVMPGPICHRASVPISNRR
jgi:hypothetical protein